MHLASVKNDLPVCPFFFGNRKQPFLWSIKLLLSQYPKKGDFILPQKYLKKKRSLGEILSGSRMGTVLKAPGSTSHSIKLTKERAGSQRWRQAGTKCSPHCPLQCWHPQQNCLLADCSSCERVAREIEERHFWHHKSILRELDARCSQWHCGWNHWF